MIEPSSASLHWMACVNKQLYSGMTQRNCYGYCTPVVLAALMAVIPHFCTSARPNLNAIRHGGNESSVECPEQVRCPRWSSDFNGERDRECTLSGEQCLIRLLLRDYKAEVRPTSGFGGVGNVRKGPPVIVHTSIDIQSIYSVDEINMEFKAQIVLMQRWTDHRLQFAHLASSKTKLLRLNRDQIIWKPDTFFQNEKYGHFHMVKQLNSASKVKPNGEILYSVRLAMAFSCVMNLLKYPMDIQKCVIEFSSYAYTTEDIVYIWDDQSFVVDPAVTSALPNMAIKTITNGTCSSKTNTGEYSCLRITLVFERSFSFFVMQLYVPTALLVAISCLSYWIDWRASAGRMLLTIVTFLTLITQNYSTTTNLPPVSYAKALDVWIGACVIFVFGALVEYAFVNFMGLSRELKGRKLLLANQERLRRLLTGRSSISGTKLNCPREYGSQNAFSRRTFKVPPSWRREGLVETVGEQWSEAGLRHYMDLEATVQSIRSDRMRRAEDRTDYIPFSNAPDLVDRIFRILMPLGFLLFNIVYWLLYR
uniref:Ig-like domain-containing protein n=1 Tax=Trichuris muris TaxID=70415 RepID=A0A5S6R507_TRIMR